MNDQTDSQLLGAWAKTRSEPAFAELVRRHVDFVHSAALRMVCDSHLAKDVTQSVFVALARDAARITDCRVLSGWLHRTAQNIAAQTVRTDARRRAREQEAATMNELLATEHDLSRQSETESDTWAHIAPHLDAALGELSEPDRDAVLLRYFENKSLREVGQALGTSDDTAQKRVSRAVERLREFFAKRGVTVGASGLVVVISANAVQAAPVGLAVTISTAAAMTGTTIAATATATAIKTIAMTTLQKSIMTAIVVASVVTPLVVQRQAQARLREQNETMRQRANQLATLQSKNEQLSNSLAQAKSNQSLPDDQFRELLRLRGAVGRLRRDVQELSQPATAAPMSRTDKLASIAEQYSERINQLKQFLATNPAENIPEMGFMTDENWLWLAGENTPDTPEGRQRAMSLARLTAESNVARDIMRPALLEYAQANPGQFPSELSQLKPYFKSPVEDAVLQRWQILSASKLINLSGNLRNENMVITQKAPVNAILDSRVVFGLKHFILFGNDAGPKHWEIAP